MMRYICLLSVLVVITSGETPEVVTTKPPPAIDEIIKINNSTSVSVSKSVSLVTNSDRKIVDDEFETAHKIPINSDSKGVDSLMQMQKTKNLLATKERPELNPVLSALINEDVMKSIESKRAAIEATETTKVTEEPEGSKPTTTLNNIVLLTTEIPKVDKPAGDLEAGNDGLIDQAINLDEAGSENNQKSRIQIKKGANGVDYEYEYVYYYYDDDEKTEKEKVTSAASSKSRSSSQAQENKDSSSRGKSRYTNIERSTTSAPENEIPSRGKGRASIPVTEDVDEGRLPAVTRFPPRSKSIEATPAPSTDGADSGEKTRKIGVKRPSLELVDSDSFNTDEKQVKGNRNFETEASKSSTSLGGGDELKNIESDISNKVPESPASSSAEIVESSTGPDEDIENTTPLMEKVAFDLYAILANENLNMDMTTDGTDAEATTDVPETTGEEGLTTDAEIEASSSSTTTTTTSTTTTTTTTPEPTTTTTTTTTPASGPGGRRTGLGNAGRNRFRLRSGSSASSTSTTESSPTESTTKGRNRFQRPSFGGRNNRPSSTSAPAKEESINKEEAKPVSSSSSGPAGGRGRTRNRFNLRGSSTTTERSADENAVDPGQISSTTSRNLRSRPTLNLRGRGRPTAAATTSAPSGGSGDSDTNNNSNNNNNNGSEEKDKDEKPTSSLPTRPSRFNINRPGAGGANRLLPRGRVSLTKTTAAPAPASAGGAPQENDGEDDEKKELDPKDAETSDSESLNNESGEEKPAEATTQAAGGLNRLRNRPRIQINTKTEKSKPQPVAINRKVNPLLARRKIGLGSSTTEAAPAEEEDEPKGENEEAKNESSESKDEPKDETTEAVEVSSEQPRGLALLGARRRLPLRKPGTIV